MIKPLPDRIAELKARKAALAARLSTLEGKAKKEGRKRDTRRKIIVGGMVLAAMERDDGFADRIKALLAAGVDRPNDRDVIADLLPGASTVAAKDCG